MRRFAHISDGKVANVSVWVTDPDDGALVEVTGLHVVIGMVRDGEGAFSAAETIEEPPVEGLAGGER